MNDSVHGLKYRQKTSRVVYNTKVIGCTVPMLNTTYLGSIKIKATLQCIPTIFNEPILEIILINPKGACKLKYLRDDVYMGVFTQTGPMFSRLPRPKLGDYTMCYKGVVCQLHRLPI